MDDDEEARPANWVSLPHYDSFVAYAPGSGITVAALGNTSAELRPLMDSSFDPDALAGLAALLLKPLSAVSARSRHRSGSRSAPARDELQERLSVIAQAMSGTAAPLSRAADATPTSRRLRGPSFGR
jgi:hypothetical protein